MSPNDCLKLLFYVLLSWNLIASGNPHDHNDFEGWNNSSEVCNTGKRQSPIDISMKNVIGKRYRNDLIKLIDYNVESNRLTIHKKGRGAKLSGLWRDKKPGVSGSLLSSETYTFYEAHIHWSEYDNNGTEHSFEGKKYAAEVHSVHVNQKYANFSEALDYSDGLAVIGILFKVDDEMPHNIGMQQFASLTQLVGSGNDTSSSDSFDLSSFLPDSLLSFYLYDGSLTTSPCTENVRWIVLADVQPISSKAMQLLRQFDPETIDSKPVRPLQQINGRKILFYDRR